MALRRRSEQWKELLYDTRDGAAHSESVAQRRLQALERWRGDWWGFLTALDIPDDPDAEPEPIIWTVDERDDSAPVKPFPSEKLYLRYIGEALWRYRIVAIDKARQMFISNFMMLLLFWYISFNEEREVVVSKVKEESAVKLMNDKIRTPFTRLPAWLKAAIPVDDKPAKVITSLATNSTVTAVAQNFAKTDARGITGSIIAVDEAAYCETLPAIYRAIVPMSSRLWMATTAENGNPGADKFRELAHEGRPEPIETGEHV